MKKLFVLLTSTLLFACSSGPSLDHLHIGIAGNSQSVNKAVAMYGLNNAEKVGKDVSLYLVGDSESDKADLEKAAKAKNVEMHYIMQK